MKERPILFSAPMVRAILAGTKTQTRRILKHPHEPLNGVTWVQDGGLWHPCTDVLCRGSLDPYAPGIRCPYGSTGDRLWVRETWHKLARIDANPRLLYRASSSETGLLWHPSIHMPRSASRITLEITDVRVERVQAISEDDARSEGVTPFFTMFPSMGRDQTLTTGERAADGEHRAGFAVLWDEINGNRATWKSNPWVWVVAFRRVEEVAA